MVMSGNLDESSVLAYGKDALERTKKYYSEKNCDLKTEIKRYIPSCFHKYIEVDKIKIPDMFEINVIYANNDKSRTGYEILGFSYKMKNIMGFQYSDRTKEYFSTVPFEIILAENKEDYDDYIEELNVCHQAVS